jgi:tRNA pseudouridine55 synthase
MNKTGYLLIDKPTGLTSFEALGGVKRALGTPKVGHTGTLDKFASGLLLVLAGRALRLVPWLGAGEKVYDALVRFGEETDTLDPEGAVVAEAALPAREAVEGVLPRFRGRLMQTPPAYSALHVGGRRAYEAARAGEAPPMRERPVTVYGLELLAWTPPLARFAVRCSAGTYVRALARDIALAAGTRGRLEALRRTRIGGFKVDNAVPPDDAEGVARGTRPLDEAFFSAAAIPVCYADEALIALLRHGRPIHALPGNHAEGPLAVLSGESGAFTALLEKTEGRWRYGVGGA